jgi:hypothetical protein
MGVVVHFFKEEKNQPRKGREKGGGKERKKFMCMPNLRRGYKNCFNFSPI